MEGPAVSDRVRVQAIAPAGGTFSRPAIDPKAAIHVGDALRDVLRAARAQDLAEILTEFLEAKGDLQVLTALLVQNASGSKEEHAVVQDSLKFLAMQRPDVHESLTVEALELAVERMRTTNDYQEINPVLTPFGAPGFSNSTVIRHRASGHTVLVSGPVHSGRASLSAHILQDITTQDGAEWELIGWPWVMFVITPGGLYVMQDPRWAGRALQYFDKTPAPSAGAFLRETTLIPLGSAMRIDTIVFLQLDPGNAEPSYAKFPSDAVPNAVANAVANQFRILGPKRKDVIQLLRESRARILELKRPPGNMSVGRYQAMARELAQELNKDVPLFDALMRHLLAQPPEGSGGPVEPRGLGRARRSS